MKSVLSHIIKFWALLGGALLLIIVIATAINAAGFGANMMARLWGGSVSGLPGYEDAVTLLVGVAGLAMFPYCQLHKGHAVVEILMEKAPAWANSGVNLISSLLTIILAVCLSYMLVLGTIEARGDNTETAVLGWPIWLFMSTSVLSCGLWALAALLNLFDMNEHPNGT